MAVSRAALEAREFERARATLQPLLEGQDGARPTVKVCRLMAEIEEAEHGETGSLFEWLQRASRAPRDPAWVADGMVSDRWARCVSPVTGQLDAFSWTIPQEQMSRSERSPRNQGAPSAADRRAAVPVEPSHDGHLCVTQQFPRCRSRTKPRRPVEGSRNTPLG